MKIVYQNAVWLIFFAAYNYLSLADDQATEVEIAAFFKNENSQTKTAFEAALSDSQDSEDSEITFQGTSHTITDDDSFKVINNLCNLTETRKIGGVVFPSDPKVAAVMESVCISLEVPALHLDWRSSSQPTDSIYLNFFPDFRLLFQGLRIIVKNLQWRSVVIFYENTENLINLQGILKTQNYDQGTKINSITIKELGPGPDYRSVLKTIQNKSEHRIILDCKVENIIPILWQAKDVGLLDERFSYFLTSLDAHVLDLSSLNTTANITTVRIMNPELSHFQEVASKMNVRDTSGNFNPYSVLTESAVMYDAMSLYTQTAKKLHYSQSINPRSLSCFENVGPWEGGLRIVSHMRSISLDPPGLTDPIGFNEFGKRVDFNISVVAGNRDEVVATWTPKDPKNLQFSKSEEDRSKELIKKWSERVVKVASILGPPYLRKRIPKEGEILKGNDRYEGFSMDLMQRLADELKITIEFDVLESGLRGAYDKKSKAWNGLIREILDRRAELAICDLTVTPERREVVDFSTPFMRLGISILYKKPEAKEANMYAFLDPLSFTLWIYTATIYLAITVVMFLIARISPRDWENPHPCDPEPEELENIWHLKNCFWLTLGSIMNQGCDILPKGLAVRMTASMWWFYAIIVTNSYMANLAAFLTNERSQGSINSAEDLSKQTKVKYGTLDQGSTQAFFQSSNYSVYQRMWTSMEQSKPSVFEKSNDDGVARVQNTKNRLYAFLMESSTLEYQIQTKCDLMQVGNWLDSKGYAIAMPLDYPHRTIINGVLLTLQEKGVIAQLKDKWWKRERGNETLCDTEDEEEASAKLALQNVGGVFVVLAVGLGVAYMVAICEFLWNVRNVSVEEHLTFMEALKIEVKFASNVFVTKKKVKRQASESSSSAKSEESVGVARSILQGAGSFLHLDILGRNTPGSTSRHSSRPLD